MALDVVVKKLNDVSAVVTLNGPLSLGTNLKILDTQLQQLVEEGVVRLIFDMTECPYADSSGLGVMMHTSGLTESKGGTIRLCGISERIARMLELTHTANLLPHDADLATSITELG